MLDDTTVVITIKYNGNAVTIDSLRGSSTVADLKEAIYEQTRVLPETQKILGLRYFKEPIIESLPLSKLNIKPSAKLMLIGSKEEAVSSVSKIVENPSESVVYYNSSEETADLDMLPENLEKVIRRSKAYRPRILCELRQNKKLLVLDIDYTIFDHLSPAESARQLARPYLYEFLQRVYVHYDIAVWSATSMTWIVAKLSQLGIIPACATAFLREQSTVESLQTSQSVLSTLDPPFRIALLLDSSDMISVNFPRHGVKEVKPLAVVWNNHSQWGPHNTIMCDDIRRNFAMNPQSGLRVRPYRDACVNRSSDRELRRLAWYLELIAINETDFRYLTHRRWKRYIDCRKQGKPSESSAVSFHQASCSVTSPSSIIRNIQPPESCSSDDENTVSVSEMNATDVLPD